MQQLLSKGYQMVVKNGFLVSKSTAQSNFNSVMDIVQNETDSYKSINSSNTVTQVDVENRIDNETLAIYDPNGNRITGEIFKMQIEFLAKELYLEYQIDLQLEKEYDLQQCKELATSFDAVMKAAEQEYLSKQ